jgi:O-antigen ligase
MGSASWWACFLFGSCWLAPLQRGYAQVLPSRPSPFLLKYLCQATPLHGTPPEGNHPHSVLTIAYDGRYLWYRSDDGTVTITLAYDGKQSFVFYSNQLQITPGLASIPNTTYPLPGIPLPFLRAADAVGVPTSTPPAHWQRAVRVDVCNENERFAPPLTLRGVEEGVFLKKKPFLAQCTLFGPDNTLQQWDYQKPILFQHAWLASLVVLTIFRTDPNKHPIPLAQRRYRLFQALPTFPSGCSLSFKKLLQPGMTVMDLHTDPSTEFVFYPENGSFAQQWSAAQHKLSSLYRSYTHSAVSGMVVWVALCLLAFWGFRHSALSDKPNTTQHPSLRQRWPLRSFAIALAAWLLCDDVLGHTPIEKLTLQYRFQPLRWGFHDPFSLVLLIAAATLTWLWYFPTSKHRDGWYLWGATGTLLMAYCLTALLTTEQGLPLVLCTLAISAMTIGLLCAKLCGSPQTLFRLLAGLGTVQTVLAIALRILGREHFLSGTVIRSSGTFDDPGALHTVMLLCTPIALALALHASKRWETWLWTLSTVLLFLTDLLTLYRWGILATAIAILWVIAAKYPKRAYMLVAACGLLGLVLFTSYLRTHGHANLTSSEGSWQGRQFLMSAAWHQFLRHPLTGVGLGMLHLWAPVGGDPEIHTVASQSFNMELDWLAQMGIAGFLLLGLFIYGFSRVLKAAQHPLKSGLAAVWLGVLINGQLEAPLIANGFTVASALLGATLLMALQGDETLREGHHVESVRLETNGAVSSVIDS